MSAEPIPPEDWTGELHRRPGLFARKPVRTEAEDTRPPHPAPAILARPAEPGELGGTAQRLIAAAGDRWAVQTLYSLGHKPLDRAPWFSAQLLPFVTVRLAHRHHPASAVAIWVAGRAHDALIWARGTDGRPADLPVKTKVTRLLEIVADPAITAWFNPTDRGTWT